MYRDLNPLPIKLPLNFIMALPVSWGQMEVERVMSQTLCGIIGNAIQAQDDDIALQGVSLWAAWVRALEPPYDPSLFQFFGKVLELFLNWLVQQKVNAHVVAQKIAYGLGTEVPLAAPDQIYGMLLTLASNDSIPVDNKHLPFVPIKKLIKMQGKHVRRFLPDTMRLLLAVSAAQYMDGHFADESDSRSIIRLVYYVCEASDKVEFVPAVLGMLNKDQNPNASFASLCALQGVLDSAPEMIEENLAPVMEYAKSKLNFNVGVTEAALSFVNSLVIQLPTSSSEYAEAWVTACLQFASMFDQEDLANIALELISTIFDYCDNLDSSMVMGFLERILSLFTPAPQTIKGYVVRALGSAMRACKDDVVNFPEPVFQLIIQASKCSEEAEIEMKVAACEALGFMLGFAKEKFNGEILSESLALLMEGCHSDDRSLSCACLRSLTYFVKYSGAEELPPGFVPYCVQASIIASKVSVESENELWDVSGVTQYYSVGEVVTAGLKMMRIIAKRHPKQFYEAILGGKDAPNLFGQWCKACVAPLVHFYDSDISCAAINTGACLYGIVIDSKSEWPFYADLVSIVEQTEETSVVVQCMKAYSKLMEQHAAEAAPFFPQFTKIAWACLNRQLRCQAAFCEDEASRFNYDADLCTAVQDLLAAAITTFKDQFPIQEFMSVFQSLVTKVSDIEANSLLGVFAMYADIGGQIPPDLVPFALSKMQSSNFTMVPDAIFFVRVLIRDQPQLVQEHIQNLIQFFMAKLQAPVTSDRYYWNTITNVISAVIDTSISERFQQILPLETFIGPIFAKLPVKGDLKEAGFIYDTLLVWASQKADLITAHLPELFRILTEVLAMPNSYIRECELNDDRLRNIVRLFSVMAQRIPNAQDLIGQILHGDPIKLAKLQRRIAAWS